MSTHYQRALDYLDRLDTPRLARTGLTDVRSDINETLFDAIERRGYQVVASSKKNLRVRRIVRNGRIVTTQSEVTAWYWLARLDRKVAALRAAHRPSGTFKRAS